MHSIGIDFGTTKTLVSHINPQTGNAETLRLGRGCDYLPSSVYVDANGHFMFGDDADDMVEDETGVYLRGFKMKLGSSTPLHMYMGEDGVRMLTAKDLVYEYLRYIKGLVEETAFMGEPVTKAVITCPVNFTPAQSDALKHAAQAAGFANVEFTSEPEAAGLAFCRLQAAHAFKGNALVVDWGGGTLDFALVRRKGDTVSTHRSHTDGDTTMGGEVFDERLWMYVNMEMKKQGVSLNPVAMLPKVRLGKEQLSARDSINLRLSHPQGVTTLPLTRNVFNRMIASDVDKAVEKVKDLLKGIPAALKPEMLLLVGGSSQIPLIKEKLEKACALPAKYWANSREAVALGACLWGTRALSSSPSVTKTTPATEMNVAASGKQVQDNKAQQARDLFLEAKTLLKGETPDFKNAYKLIRKAAEQGDYEAAYWLGCFYDYGIGTRVNRSSAYQWHQCAADNGFFCDANLLEELKTLHARDLFLKAKNILEGATPDYKKAYKLIRKAAEQGDYEAAYWLGWFYHQGIGTDVDLWRAYLWYQCAVDNGNSGAAGLLEEVKKLKNS